MLSYNKEKQDHFSIVGERNSVIDKIRCERPDCKSDARHMVIGAHIVYAPGGYIVMRESDAIVCDAHYGEMYDVILAWLRHCAKGGE